ncbi:hypothetical protein JAAARDRAFT_137953, partial [Jaapia argillacea MUCL 33604]
RKYLSAVRAWHLAQGWPPPLSEEDHTHINWSLRGLANLHQGCCTRPPQPPVTLPMLRTLKSALILDNPFDACVWVMASCAFWGMMHFGEVPVKSQAAFSPVLHLKRSDSFFRMDLNGCHYAQLDLPSAKTAAPGEVQHVYLMEEGDVCPLRALQNLAQIVPAAAKDPLFSWRDNKGDIRPMIQDTALARINAIFVAYGWGTLFSHSFCIGGASFFLTQKVDPETVRLAGCWKSLAYEAYIHAFEQIASRHMADLA